MPPKVADGEVDGAHRGSGAKQEVTDAHPCGLCMRGNYTKCLVLFDFARGLFPLATVGETIQNSFHFVSEGGE